jgi:ribosomal protein S27AE
MPPSSMICPDCGEAMNHHADKVDYAAALDNPAALDPVYGGLLEEVFTCPHCGMAATRPAG